MGTNQLRNYASIINRTRYKVCLLDAFPAASAELFLHFLRTEIHRRRNIFKKNPRHQRAHETNDPIRCT